MSAMVLEARRLTVTATIAGRDVEALRGIDFSLPAGAVLGLVGESGAGKSMIGRAVAQLLPPGFRVSAGGLFFEGRDLVAMPGAARRALLGRDIAFIPQEPLTALNPVLTIGRQLDEHVARLGLDRPARRARIAEMLSAVRLPEAQEFLRRYPHQLSGGMCQRVLIAMAFSSRPKLVVADEPTTALDVTTQAHVVALIRAMQRDTGTALLFVTHDLKLAAQVCDEILVLYAGRAVERGPAKAVFTRPAHPYTRCLQLADPSATAERRPLFSLPDRMPGLVGQADLPGCRFAPRCPLATRECEAGEPEPRAAGAERLVACLRPEATAGIRPGPEPPRPAIVAGIGAPLLEMRAVAKHFRLGGGLFRAGKPLAAVADFDLTVADGEFVGIVGESGSGKSTVARMIVGLTAASAGVIRVGGRDVTQGGAEARRARLETVRMVFQDPQSALNPRRRVGAIVSQALEAVSPRPTWPDRLERARALLADMGLPAELAARYPGQLSGGQRQRVNIARALAVRPRLLVADEIVSGLDVSIQAQLIELLAGLRAAFGFAMVFISHDLSVVRHLCDRVLVMRHGRVVEAGATQAVFAAPRHAYTRALLAAAPPDDPDAVWTSGSGDEPP